MNTASRSAGPPAANEHTGDASDHLDDARGVDVEEVAEEDVEGEEEEEEEEDDEQEEENDEDVVCRNVPVYRWSPAATSCKGDGDVVDGEAHTIVERSQMRAVLSRDVVRRRRAGDDDDGDEDDDDDDDADEYDEDDADDDASMLTGAPSSEDDEAEAGSEAIVKSKDVTSRRWA